MIDLLEASGLAAIETDIFRHNNDTTNKSFIVPLPLMNIEMINDDCGQIGKLFINSPYCSLTEKRPENGWIYTGYIGYYDDNNHLQIIDYYKNFICLENNDRTLSKTLIETILLSNENVYRVVVLAKLANIDGERRCQILVQPFEDKFQNEHSLVLVLNELDNLLKCKPMQSL